MPKKPRPEQGFVIVEMSWDELKAIVAAKSLRMQFVDDGLVYFIFALDSSILYRTELPSAGREPANADQVAKAKIAADRREFDQSFKAGSNQRISASAV